MKKILTLITVIGVTVAALTYALWDIDFAELGRLLSGGDYRVLVPILLLLVMFYWMKAKRWDCMGGSRICPPATSRWARNGREMSVAFGCKGRCARPACLARTCD